MFFLFYFVVLVRTDVRTRTEPFEPGSWVQVQVQVRFEMKDAVQVQVRGKRPRTEPEPNIGNTTWHSACSLGMFVCLVLSLTLTHAVGMPPPVPWQSTRIYKRWRHVPIGHEPGVAPEPGTCADRDERYAPGNLPCPHLISRTVG